MQVAVLTFDGFNELDSFIAAGIINRQHAEGCLAFITSPSPKVTSMNGLTVEAERGLDFVAEADAVIIGSGMRTREIARDESVLRQLRRLNPQRQLIGAQCSGTLLLARLGLLEDRPACTDLATKPWVIEAGVRVLNQPFYADGNIATAGGCFSSQYLAAWLLLRGAGEKSAHAALHYVAPVGQKEEYVNRALNLVKPFLPPPIRGSAHSHLAAIGAMDSRV